MKPRAPGLTSLLYITVLFICLLSFSAALTSQLSALLEEPVKLSIPRDRARSLHMIVEKVVDAGDNAVINFDLLVEAMSNPENEYLCQLPNSTELFAQAGYQFLDVDKSDSNDKVQVTACERVDTNGSTTVPPLPEQPEALAFGCSAFDAISSMSPDQLCMEEGRMAYDYFHSPIPAGFNSQCNCQQATRCKDGESWPVDKAGNTYPGRTADEAWWEATRDDEWKYDTAVCTTTGCSCWLACTKEEYDPCKGVFVGDGQLTVNQINQYLYDGYPQPPTHDGSGSSTTNSQADPQFRLQYRISGFNDMNAAIAEANRIRKLAPELGASVQNAFGSAAEVALTEKNSIEMLEVDNPVSKDQTRSLLGIFSYVGILPSSFQSCASDMASGTFGSDKNTQVAIQEQAEDVKVYTEVPTGMDSEKSAKQMWNLIDGAMLTNCASRASINSGDIPMMEVQQASDPGSAPTTHKSASLPWYAWLLIAIGIVIVIAACVYVWWLLSSRRKQREKQAKMSESCEGAGEGSSERGLISGVAPATGYIDDDAATATVTGIGSISTHARLPSSATHRASVLAEVPTAVVSVNPDGSLTPRLPLAPKNPAPKSSISLIASTPNSHPHWDTTRSHEAPY